MSIRNYEQQQEREKDIIELKIEVLHAIIKLLDDLH